MKINISYTSDKPMYEQIEDCIRQAALSGELENNHPLPSVRQLAADANVSTITVKRAYSDLEREGILYTVSGKGTYIRLDNMEKIQDEHVSALLSELEKNVEELHKADTDKKKIIAVIDKIYND
ncbi:MAG: GntR family transcriptional regulator [Oscillospiraceae bacterium]|nr:GntR family transcriptional regulator [Oscillospiraceae bacterium]